MTCLGPQALFCSVTEIYEGFHGKHQTPPEALGLL